MRMTVSRQAMWWGGGALVLALILWGLGNTLTPFLIGAGIAYILNPVAGWLERRGLSRTLAVAAITLLVVLIFAVLLISLIPLAITQTSQLIQAAPGYLDALQAFLSSNFPQLMPADGTMSATMNEAAQRLSDVAGTVIPAVMNSVTGVFGVLMVALLVPVVAFYMLLDWDKMIAAIDALLPREHADTIRDLGGQIDSTLSGFMRGQATVTLILGAFYSVSLMAVGLPFGLAIGIIAAVLSIIPFVGVFVGGVLAIGVALFHFWGEPLWIGIVVAIFVFGQVMESNVLQPKIVGGHVGLHPVWLMLALVVFGALFGFVGLVVAVPLAAMLGVLVRFAVARYRASPLYTGIDEPPPPPSPLLVEMVPPGTAAQTRAAEIDAGADAIAEAAAEDAPAAQADDAAGQTAPR